MFYPHISPCISYRHFSKSEQIGPRFDSPPELLENLNNLTRLLSLSDKEIHDCLIHSLVSPFFFRGCGIFGTGTLDKVGHRNSLHGLINAQLEWCLGRLLDYFEFHSCIIYIF